MHVYSLERLSAGKTDTVAPKYFYQPLSKDSASALRLEHEIFERSHIAITPDVLPILRKATNRRFPGTDGIRPSTFKLYDPEAIIISKFCSIAYLTSHFPPSWCMAAVTARARTTNLQNRRSIAVFTLLRWIYSKTMISFR